MEANRKNVGQTSNEIGSNKRKRKSHQNETDIENQRPSKRANVSTQVTENTSDTQSSYDCCSSSDSEGFPLSSPQSLNNILNSPQEASPSAKESNSVNTIESTITTATAASSTTATNRGDSTPHGQKNYSEYSNTVSCCITPSSDLRLCPLPALSWAEAKDVWKFMCRKDEKASLERDSSMLVNHPGLQPRMRAILLDWLIEVCEVYKLHRETYYLAVDYLDRFLSSNTKVSKTRLQLIGITCLFVAAKVEEIYPPKIGEFAYVTDGACQEDDIVQQELLLLTALNWCISPVTIIGWLSVYMQLHVSNRTPKSFTNNIETEIRLRGKPAAANVTATVASAAAVDDNEGKTQSDDAFIYPQFSSMEFAQAAQLIDLCTLDLGIANYPYSVIAAAAIVHTFNKQTALRVSGLEWNVISACVKWMQPFFEVIQEECSQVFLLEQNEQVKASYGLNHISPNIITDDSHIIQTHTTSMSMFDKAMSLREKAEREALIIRQEASPAQNSEHSCSHGLLTPPASNRKFLDNYNIEHESGIKNTKPY